MPFCKASIKAKIVSELEHAMRSRDAHARVRQQPASESDASAQARISSDMTVLDPNSSPAILVRLTGNCRQNKTSDWRAQCNARGLVLAQVRRSPRRRRLGPTPPWHGDGAGRGVPPTHCCEVQHGPKTPLYSSEAALAPATQEESRSDWHANVMQAFVHLCQGCTSW